ncbi:uncharacterized protein LOC129597463 isoform X2 [Paramacrobiotus metropolitanus]|uniref:uncharacterized protein LOC129597463 isoform X2 n=1 Tax=Paramacrobiotus metropolitanus TaxID=2943436 RepID=UPI0024462DA5|nr:uncharacterized protein LOC129597463 isoform X2 [Paramacrobiotus metropolitanus]
MEQLRLSIQHLAKLFINGQRHEYVQAYYGVDYTGRRPGTSMTCYILSEDCQGTPLDSLMQTKIPDEYKVLSYARKILQGLEFLHKHKIIHQDIRGANVIVSEGKETLKITGLNMMKCFDSDTTPPDCVEHAAGTVPFLSPEMAKLSTAMQNEKSPVGRKSDIWSFGCTLVELMQRGQPPVFHKREKDGHPVVMDAHSTTFENMHYYFSEQYKPQYPTAEQYHQIRPQEEKFLDACFMHNATLRPTASQLLNMVYFNPVIPTGSIAAENQLFLVTRHELKTATQMANEGGKLAEYDPNAKALTLVQIRESEAEKDRSRKNDEKFSLPEILNGSFAPGWASAISTVDKNYDPEGALMQNKQQMYDILISSVTPKTQNVLEHFAVRPEDGELRIFTAPEAYGMVTFPLPSMMRTRAFKTSLIPQFIAQVLKGCTVIEMFQRKPPEWAAPGDVRHEQNLKPDQSLGDFYHNLWELLHKEAVPVIYPHVYQDFWNGYNAQHFIKQCFRSATFRPSCAMLMEDDFVNDVSSDSFGSSCQYCFDTTEIIRQDDSGTTYSATITDRGDFTGDDVVTVKIIPLFKGTTDTKADILKSAHSYQPKCDKLKELLQLRNKHTIAHHKATIRRKLAVGEATVELLMDKWTGITLDQHIKSIALPSRLDYSSVIKWGIQITEGVRFLHGKNIVHGDLKPANILIGRWKNGEPILVIGCLEHFIRVQESGNSDVRGTESYMSPEMLRRLHIRPENLSDLPVDMRSIELGLSSDIWSLGCVLLEVAECQKGVRYKKLRYDGKDNVKERVIETLVDDINGHITNTVHGFVPYLDDSVDDDELRGCISDCLRTNSSERISAVELKGQLKNLLLGLQKAGEAKIPVKALGSDCQYNKSSDCIDSFGKIYRAVVTSRGAFSGKDQVAVKLVYVNPDVPVVAADNNYGNLRLRLEKLLDLRHENILRYHKATITRAHAGPVIELLMDYCEGGDLSVFLKQLRARMISWIKGWLFAFPLKWPN